MNNNEHIPQFISDICSMYQGILRDIFSKYLQKQIRVQLYYLFLIYITKMQRQINTKTGMNDERKFDMVQKN